MSGEDNRPVAVVTGAARGIGRAITWKLADAGFRIAALDILDGDVIDEMRDGIIARGSSADYFRCDVSAIAEHRALISQIVERLGRIDCFISNAGVQSPTRGDILDMAPDAFDYVIGVNLRGAFFLAQAAARWLVDHPNSSVPRSMIFISSTNASIPSPRRSEYCVSKAGLAMAAQLFALRLAPHDIPVFEIRPGTVRTAMTRDVAAERDARIANGAVPIARWGEPDDVGRLVATLATGGVSFMTGATLFVDGGANLRPN